MSHGPNLAVSPCCTLPLVLVAAGMCHANHYRCSECNAVFVWSGSEWVACQTPEEHLAITRIELAALNIRRTKGNWEP